MSSSGAERNVVFVCRRPAGESLRAARAVGGLDGVRLLGVCEELPGAEGAAAFVELVRVADAHDAGQLLDAARGLSERHGPLWQIVTSQETQLEPVARANDALGLRGLSVAAVRRALDKSILKETLAGAGVGTARDSLLNGEGAARRFAAEVGFPFVLKPTGGSGGLTTWCVRDPQQLETALGLLRPSAARPVLAEAYLRGRELCLDTVTIAGEPRFHSVCLYRPTILEALEDASVRWSCLMPREIEGGEFREFISQGLRAVRALAVGDAMTHMEGFLLEGGGVAFTDATLRPAGARIGPMLGHAYDVDTYRVWARAAVDGRFDGPWERRYAVGTLFLRDAGGGAVERVHGLEEVKRQVGRLIVEARPPRAGAPKSATYTGDGYLTLRHPETRVVEDALAFVAAAVRVEYSRPEAVEAAEASAGARWSRRLREFEQKLYRPAWDEDPPPRPAADTTPTL